ncbi:MAG: putative HTH-type transcriptional regulator [Planctomycetota bacterium]|nr:MAG: putative HTH-type transcriptional regulator [Planctomycetota bacterium]
MLERLTPIRRSSLAAEIAGELRRRILEGDFAAGSRLPPERELAQRLGTNRNTLREALRLLEAQGLVRVRHGEGTLVRDPRTAGTLELVAPFLLEGREPAARLEVFADALQLRRFIAAEAAAAAAASAGHRSAAERLVAALEQVLALPEEPARRAEADLELFATLIDSSGRLLYRWALNGILGACRAFIEHAPALWWFPDDYERFWRALIAAIAAGEPARARSLCNRYFARTDRELAALFAGLVGAEAPQLLAALAQTGVAGEEPPAAESALLDAAAPGRQREEASP